ncbi:MAG: cell division protein FtsL [Lachnospiraceae bacterium]|nr:cell division protein FtsL [Lachnospiraceae bacterium]
MHSYNYQRTGFNARENRYGHREKSTSHNTYVDGNLARKYQAYEPYEDEDKEWLREIYRQRDVENAREERARKSRQRRLEQAKSISVSTFVMLAAVVGVIVYLCIGYIQAQSSVTALNNEIIKLETDYDALKAKNDSDYKEIEATVDLQKIYNTATKELGMVFANNNKIVTYDNNESAYVRQYEDIDEEYEENVWDDIADAVN